MITSSVILMGLSTVVGAIFKLIATKMENSRALEEAKLKALNAQAVVTEAAREFRSKGFEFTRRFIAITMTIFVIAVPYLAVLWYQWMYPIDIVTQGLYPPIIFGYETINSGFWPFTSDTTTTTWKEFTGLVITPWHTDMFSVVMGLYFGNRLGNGRM